jgi:DnaJ like chaperone protein
MKWLWTILALMYLLNPFDALPDFVVGAGWLDDLVVLGLVGYYLYRAGYRGFPFNGGASRGHPKTDAPHDAPGNRQALDPYQTLGVAPDAGQDEIRQAYRRLAAQYHPDKAAHLGEELRLLAEKKFKAIQEAYEKLRKS